MLRSKAADQTQADDVDDPSKTSPGHEVSLDIWQNRYLDGMESVTPLH